MVVLAYTIPQPQLGAVLHIAAWKVDALAGFVAPRQCNGIVGPFPELVDEAVTLPYLRFFTGLNRAESISRAG